MRICRSGGESEDVDEDVRRPPTNRNAEEQPHEKINLAPDKIICRAGITRDDYLKLLQIYTRTHRHEGRPFIAEAAHPDTGSWDGHNSYNHSEHYFHSGYCDLIVTGLIGLRPRADDTVELDPLAPTQWDYFALDDLPYRGHRLGIFWDKTGQRYGLGTGLHLVVDGKTAASSTNLTKLATKIPPATAAATNLTIGLGSGFCRARPETTRFDIAAATPSSSNCESQLVSSEGLRARVNLLSMPRDSAGRIG